MGAPRHGIQFHFSCDEIHNFFFVFACNIPQNTILETPNPFNTFEHKLLQITYIWFLSISVHIGLEFIDRDNHFKSISTDDPNSTLNLSSFFRRMF